MEKILRYSEQDLAEFRQLVLHKKQVAQEKLKAISDSLSFQNPNGTNDTAGGHQSLEDGASTLEKEQLHQLAARQRKFIEQLDSALFRIENKTYGICRATGKLIAKERLRAVPHTTLCMEAKSQAA